MVEIYNCLQRVLNWKKLEHLQNLDINSTTPLRQRHAVFHSFISDERNQDATTTT